MGHGDYVASAMDGVDPFTHQPYRSVNGDPSCPCLSLPVYRSFLANASVARTSDGNGTVMLYSYGEDGVYPGDYGVGCHAHDSMLPPNCLLGQYCDKGQETVLRNSTEETVAKVKGENSLAALRSVHRSHRALASLAAAAEASEKRRQSTRRPPRSIATAGDTIMKARRLLHDNLDAVRRIGKRDTAAPAMAPAPVALGGVQEAGEDDDADGGESGRL